MFSEKQLLKFLERFDESKRQRMQDIYKTSLLKHKQECAESVQNRDSDRLQHTAHDLKSLGYTIEAQELGQMAENVEGQIIEDNAAQAFENTPDLISCIDQVLSVLDA